MTEDIRQSQKAGSDSVNVQMGAISINQTGLSYQEVKEIAFDVFNANFERLSKVAASKACERAEEMTISFLDRLQNENPVGLEKAQEPHFQVSLFTAQREYARTGDSQLCELLVDLLIDMSKHPARSLQQIVLDESLTVAPKLTGDQLAALGIVFMFRYSIVPIIYSFQQFADYCEQRIRQLSPILSKNENCYRHLESIGCARIDVRQVDLRDALAKYYPAAFTDGFSQKQLEDALPELRTHAVLAPSPQNSTNFQFCALNTEMLVKNFREKGLSEALAMKADRFWESTLWPPEKVQAEVTKRIPEMGVIFDVWADSSLKNLVLTTVGMAIAHAWIRMKSMAQDDLSIWIN